MESDGFSQWVQEAKLALFVAVATVVVTLAGIVWFISDLPLRVSIAIALVPASVPFLLWPLVLRLRHSRARGRVLLDCGPHPMRIVFILMFALICATMFFFAMDVITSGFGEISQRVSLLLLPLMAASTIVVASERLQLVENGVWLFGRLTRWDEIATFHWSSDSTLFVRMRGPMAALRSYSVRVPSEHREAIDLALRGHGASGGAGSSA